MSWKDLKPLFFLQFLVLWYRLKRCTAKCDFMKQQIPAAWNMLLKVFWDGLKGTPVYDTSDTMWAFTNLSCVFTTHSLEKSKPNCIQIMSNVVWIKQRQVIAIPPPFLPVQVLKWRELTRQVNGRLWLLTGHTVNVQSCIVFARECADCKVVVVFLSTTVL